MILDVGCGHRPFGDVNVDLYPEPTWHRSKSHRTITDSSIRVRRYPNFIRADGNLLPFPSETFEVVHCSDVLEHVKSPYVLLSELVRVARPFAVLELHFAYRYAYGQSPIAHVSFLNRTWIERAWQQLGVASLVNRYSDFKYFPHTFMPIFRIPTEIEAVGRKLDR